MMSEEKFSYEQTRHLFDQDQDGATCQHVWRLQENLVNQHQITRVCVVCHASNGFPDSYDFLRGNYTNAENENLRHYLELKQLEQRLTEAQADIRAAITDYRNEHAKLEEARALLELIGTEEEPDIAEGPNDDRSCYYCGAWEDYEYHAPADQPRKRHYQHEPDCTWVKIRAFLAQ